MPSSFSASLRFELQFTGENVNLWGDKLNVVLQHADYAIAGWLTKALTTDYTLTTANTGDDEARAAMLKFTGAGPFNVTIPSVSKAYDVWNACSAALTITTGAGASVALDAGERCRLVCDGSNVYRIQPTNFGGGKIGNVGYPSAGTDAASKQYVDDVAFQVAAGNLPGQTGNAGKVLITNGSALAWGGAIFSNQAASGASQALTSGGAALGGWKSDNTGLVGLINSSLAWRLKTQSDGTVIATSDAGVSNTLSTQAFAVAMGMAL
jgi:hypothetical protein